MRPTWALTAVGAILAMILVLVPAAQAATKEYVGGNATNFASGPGGWSSAEDYDGLCIQGVTCPSMGGSFRPNGGSGGYR